jgi:hypothetical protein
MSHVAIVETIILDLDALKKACQACGLEFKENQTTFRWYGKWMNDYSSNDAAYKSGYSPQDYGKCIHAIGVPYMPKAYEIGVVQNKNGPGWVLLWDFYGGGFGLEALAGKDCSKLTAQYNKAVVMQEASNNGLSMISEEIDAQTGDIVLLYCQE